jgi:hypothetical protein
MMEDNVHIMSTRGIDAVTKLPQKPKENSQYTEMTLKERLIESSIVAVIATMFTRRTRTWHDIAHVFLFVGIAFYLCDMNVPTMSDNFRSSIFSALAFGFFDAENFFARGQTSGGNLIQTAFAAT